MKKKRFWFDCEFIDGETLDLISIGMVSEDDIQYYAVSSDFDPAKVNQWVKDNVLTVLHTDARISNDRIREDLIKFVGNKCEPEFWSYCGAYDWVILCRLFGGMKCLPLNWPNYYRELNHWADDLGVTNLPPMKIHTRRNALYDARWHREIWNQLSYSLLNRK